MCVFLIPWQLSNLFKNVQIDVCKQELLNLFQKDFYHYFVDLLYMLQIYFGDVGERWTSLIVFGDEIRSDSFNYHHQSLVCIHIKVFVFASVMVTMDTGPFSQSQVILHHHVSIIKPVYFHLGWRGNQCFGTLISLRCLSILLMS